MEGLREFQRSLRFLEPEVKQRVKQANKELAEIVAVEARQRASARPRKVQTNTFAPRIKTGLVLREPSIRVLGHPKKKGRTGSDAKVQEYGGRAPLFGNRSRWFEVRPRKKGGYFLFPAVKAKRDEFTRKYLEALERALRGS